MSDDFIYNAGIAIVVYALCRAGIIAYKIIALLADKRWRDL
jgi:hypothetical protein